ncbi:hypothetical protein AGLY_004950 [Aphis glycines]|uniref:Uncharacterized protein n=1 Tax=Aphis glycines TaxID=307491 RepID=A0A6G0TVC6_APHGL|nr:hypothetical protein AGLY_004950 [Aphis glycines]
MPPLSLVTYNDKIANMTKNCYELVTREKSDKKVGTRVPAILDIISYFLSIEMTTTVFPLQIVSYTKKPALESVVVSLWRIVTAVFKSMLRSFQSFVYTYICILYIDAVRTNRNHKARALQWTTAVALSRQPPLWDTNSANKYIFNDLNLQKPILSKTSIKSMSILEDLTF